MTRFTYEKQRMHLVIRNWVLKHAAAWRTSDPPPSDPAGNERITNVLLLIVAVLCFVLVFGATRP